MTKDHSIRIFSLLLALAALAPAQQSAQANPQPQAPSAPVPQVDYSRPRSHLPNLFFPYVPRTVQAPSFDNTPRLDALVHDKKLQLSLTDAVALALENNLDLVIARYNLSIADTDILRSKAGASVRGVSTGIVQGTPGGSSSTLTSSGSSSTGSGNGSSSGSGVGGTSAGTGGTGSGNAGLVLSTLGTGANIDSFDPTFTSSLRIFDTHTPSLSAIVFDPFNPAAPAGFSLQQHTGAVGLGYSQAWATGTSLNFNMQNDRLTTNAIRAAFNPEYTVDWTATVRQHLLQGFGFGSNLRFIRIAKNNKQIADVAFRGQVISTVSQIQNIYWDLVNAAENVRVQEESVALANKTLSDDQAQVEVGTLAPLEVVRARSELAARKQDLIVAQSNYELQQLLMKNAISRQMNQDLLEGVQVVPTDVMMLPAKAPAESLQDLVTEALASRYELVQARIDLKNREITKGSSRNALLPSVDFVASYGGSGLTGARNPLCPPGSGLGCGPGTGGGGGGGGGGSNAPFVGDYGDAFYSAFGKDYPSYSVGLNVNIPIRNRAAQADQVRSELEMRQAQARLQQLENQIKIEVRNAQFNLDQSLARVETAQAGVDLARQTLDAEQDKLSVGASTPYLLLQAQRDLVQAESNLVAATTAYQKSRVEFERAMGRTLKTNSISIADAVEGRVSQMPVMQGAQPREQH